MSYLVLQNFEGQGAHPVNVVSDPDDVKGLGDGEFAAYEMKGDFPPTLKLVGRRKNKTTTKSTEIT